MDSILLKIEHLSKHFYERRAAFSRRTQEVAAVRDVTLDVTRGSIFAVVGESGSGKTTLARTIARIHSPTKGRIWLDGCDISSTHGRELRKLRSRVQMVFQDPGSSLNPKHTIETSLALPLRIHTDLDAGKRRSRVRDLLSKVELPEEFALRYPGSLSGGQKQRVALARALALNPELLILDEPTSALDVSVQAKVLQLLQRIQRETHLTIMLITHDLSIVYRLADRVAVMYAGEVVEEGNTNDVFREPLHPYTRALLSAIPVITEKERCLLPAEVILKGDAPSPRYVPPYCAFYERCPDKCNECKEAPSPALEVVDIGRKARCHLLGEGTLLAPTAT